MVGQLVRAAGTPAVTYAVETVGMADTHLLHTRRAIGRAAAPEGCGKNPDLVLWASDGLHGELLREGGLSSGEAVVMVVEDNKDDSIGRRDPQRTRHFLSTH